MDSNAASPLASFEDKGILILGGSSESNPTVALRIAEMQDRTRLLELALGFVTSLRATDLRSSGIARALGPDFLGLSAGHDAQASEPADPRRTPQELSAYNAALMLIARRFNADNPFSEDAVVWKSLNKAGRTPEVPFDEASEA